MSETTPAKPDQMKALLTGVAAAALVLLGLGATAAISLNDKLEIRLRQERTDTREWAKETFATRAERAADREENIRAFAAISALHKGHR